MDANSGKTVNEKNHIMVVKWEPNDQEPNSESEDQMTTLNHFLISKRKPIIPTYSSSEVNQEIMSLENCERPLRRSKRIKRCPVSDISYVTGKSPWRISRKKLKSRVDTNDLKAPSSPVLDRAKEVQANLDPQFPSILKLMRRSHVTKGFWLGLPAQFCKMHLPRHDEVVILEAENGEKYKTKFLAAKIGLTGGWKAFASAKKLVEGDVAVYHLVECCRFMVYIVRKTCLGEVDGALGLLNSENYTSEKGCGEGGEVTEGNDMKTCNGFLLNDAGSFERSISFLDFQNFNIIVNNHLLDSELEHLQFKYFDLCHAQKSYLHVGLLKSVSCELASVIISETVNIADAMKSCKISTCEDNFALWDKTLASFELLGMAVGFLRSRLEILVKLVIQSREIPESKRYKQAKIERILAKEETSTLEVKHLGMQQVKCRYGLKFQEEANAPW